MIPAVMISHISRKATLRKNSLRELEQVGIKPQVIESTYTGNTPDAEVRRLGLVALWGREKTGVLFLEDDITINPELFRWHLDRAMKAKVLTAFCTVNERHYQPRVLHAIKAKKPVQPCLMRIPNYDADKGFHGSMAMWIPPSVVRFAMDNPHHFSDGAEVLTEPVIPPDYAREKVTGFDFWLKWAARELGVGMFSAIPNPVNHVGRRNGAWQSISYNAKYYRPASP